MKILITGEHGQVTQALQRALQGLGEVVALGSQALDLRQPEAIRQAVRRERPGLIINPAAYTAVDKAETDQADAFAVNANAPGVLAEEAAELGVPLLHYSTDYVFDGSKAGRYVETDPTAPLGVYGASKLAGEQAIAAVGGAHLVLRTSWVYSRQGKNFLLTMQRLLQEKPELRVVADQVGAPTWAGTIAASTRQLIERWQGGNPGAWGVYHLAAGGETSWFGFAEAIGAQLRAAGKPCATLAPISTADYPTPAKRPLNSRLDCSKLAQEWGVSLPDWHTALLACLAER
ncbi:dTDP-4-dehydrorhamnose reductase [Pseudomonas sp. NPDC007930]|uniref:dTDP-4-dehydrorhamnose reductase n=1 Tax=Pseudomonas sp. NPDC007930 TaxID=3364417 RepID=UPI0036E490FD